MNTQSNFLIGNKFQTSKTLLDLLKNQLIGFLSLSILFLFINFNNVFDENSKNNEIDKKTTTSLIVDEYLAKIGDGDGGGNGGG